MVESLLSWSDRCGGESPGTPQHQDGPAPVERKLVAVVAAGVEPRKVGGLRPSERGGWADDGARCCMGN